MQKKELLNLCWNEFNPIVEGLNLLLDDIEYVKEPKGNVLRLYLDKVEDLINIEDCERVSKLVSKKLDELDPIEEQYYLEVSSIGIDRPFNKDKDFEKNIGNEVVLKFYGPIDGKKEVIGLLEDFDNKKIIIKLNDNLVEFDRKKVATIKLSIF